MPPTPDTGKKEKKTRRRLRLSCVECTKRRQTFRGAIESFPAASRPPIVPPPGTSDASIQLLSARIASLEQTVVAERLRNRPRPDNSLDTLSQTSPQSSSRGLSLSNEYSPHTSVVSLHSASNPNSPYSSPEPYSQEDESECIITPLPDTVYHTVSSLTQQSIAHFGEFIGRASSLSALYSISSKASPRLLHVPSTESSVLFQSVPHSETASASVLRLIHALPSSSIVTSLCQSFFKDANWRYGIPEQWFHGICNDMWSSLGYPVSQPQINPNWLSLCSPFSPSRLVMALNRRATCRARSSSFLMLWRPVESARARTWLDHPLRGPLPPRDRCSPVWQFRSCATTLLKEGVSAKLGSSSATLSSARKLWVCTGTPTQCDWQKMSEDMMSEDEKLLRRRAWWGMFIWERMYALVLGRPTVIRSETSDVVVPAPINPDGTRNFFNVYQRAFIQLLHLVGETVEKCFGIAPPVSAIIWELDRKFELWDSQLPSEFHSEYRSEYQTMSDDLDAQDSVALSRQRYTLSTWYLLCRSKLHLSLLTSQDDPAFMGVWGGHGTRKRSRNLCVSLASDLIRLQCDAHTNATRCRNEQTHDSVLTGSNWCFSGCFSLFEGAVTLTSLLPENSWQGRPGDPDTLVHQAAMLLTQVASEEQSTGAIAQMGGEALMALVQELCSRAGTESDLHRIPTNLAGFTSTPFITNMASTTPTYEWYSPETAFGLSTEYISQSTEGKEVPRYNLEPMRFPMLMSYEDGKSYENKLMSYESSVRA
ncbi:hypothetical protein FB45DRAFT_860691 [Roridomyces roridus]|uniref:Xylanolytic transcriptional activator regulatory domain-containing protein n=1 Tax=Roridomyces roridus TaxID=1738132 RepID=A0AAD7CFX8_9AGAR|nr:hypothetical protein FB45DRAFT_860691 [Roridomyces roridus]